MIFGIYCKFIFEIFYLILIMNYVLFKDRNGFEFLYVEGFEED